MASKMETTIWFGFRAYGYPLVISTPQITQLYIIDYIDTIVGYVFQAGEGIFLRRGAGLFRNCRLVGARNL